MAAGYREFNLEGRQTDTYPLLMDHNSSSSNQEHVLTITPGTSDGLSERFGPHQGSDSTSLPVPAQCDTSVSVVPPSSLSTSAASHLEATPTAGSLGSSASLRRHGDSNSYGARHRASPLNSGLWISIELTITVSQIIASIIVLSLSRDEKPKAPLSVWVLGYAAGCLATLPLLYWRYTHHYARQPDQDTLGSSVASASSPPSSPHNSYGLPQRSASQGELADASVSTVSASQVSVNGDSRIAVHMERFKIALDCFFAVWFVVGNVWIFGGHSSSREAPNLYRLCIVFLTFSCIGYAMPFIICATICCCLPCIITLLGFREDQGQAKGAAPELIEALPIYKFKTRSSSGSKGQKDGNDSDCESPGEGGVFAAGTEKERLVSGEDSICCICLGKYKDGVDLRELPCTHFFHVECVDKWLKINASCPLCKHGITGSDDQSEQRITDSGD